MHSLLLCRPDRVGDVILATACLAPLRAQLPDVRIFFAARPAMQPLLEDHPSLAGFIALPAPPGERAASDALADRFRASQADTLAMLHPDPLVQSAARAAGIARRVGYCSGWCADRYLTDRIRDRRPTGERHEAAANFDVLAPLGIRAPPLDTLRPRVHLPVSCRQSLAARLTAVGGADFRADAGGDYAVLNPTAHSLAHRWPPEHWAWLARTLRDHGFARVFFVGASADDPSAMAIRRLLAPGVPGVIDLSGQTNLAELGWLLSAARVCISRNTGSTHLAAAVGCPTVELFGRIEPRYGPARWRALGERIAAVTTEVGPRRWLESRRAYWRRGHAAIAREAVLAATLATARTRPDAAPRADKRQTPSL